MNPAALKARLGCGLDSEEQRHKCTAKSEHAVARFIQAVEKSLLAADQHKPPDVPRTHNGHALLQSQRWPWCLRCCCSDWVGCDRLCCHGLLVRGVARGPLLLSACAKGRIHRPSRSRSRFAASAARLKVGSRGNRESAIHEGIASPLLPAPRKQAASAACCSSGFAAWLLLSEEVWAQKGANGRHRRGEDCSRASDAKGQAFRITQRSPPPPCRRKTPA